ncbi:CPBP family intramembrane glutamic endopeptidase [Pseudalkalibacillus caeni]|uniref:CPBP family intramembrane metalloprotease n=1 Tax=Exobacillus caeni TaxID=2574798 RepID=A0A5R9EW64_9BACL|nr:type II CAAX endopeptidase family protein [Pseudalkalibacillus caeni]TLS35287.1 CPBP family intramembrane metalloprotease [Pseudalkalibacillus caeni]
MAKNYWAILITYILMQLSGFVGIPLMNGLGVNNPIVMWSVVSFLGALIIILFLIKATPNEPFMRSDRMPVDRAILWSIIGVFLAYAAQIAAGIIETELLGIKPGSENTQALVEYAKAAPIFIVVTSVFGPILEEIVFRKVIFGSLYKRFNFWISALLSSLIFGAIHMELVHLLMYFSMGLVFAFLYVKTKRLIVPIIAHVTMNTIVVLINVFLGDKIMEMQKQLEQLESFIGGFWL